MERDFMKNIQEEYRKGKKLYELKQYFPEKEFMKFLVHLYKKEVKLREFKVDSSLFLQKIWTISPVAQDCSDLRSLFCFHFWSITKKTRVINFMNLGNYGESPMLDLNNYTFEVRHHFNFENSEYINFDKNIKGAINYIREEIHYLFELMQYKE